ncbi:MAG: potassium channel family protein [Planctomycetota bacterium]
MLDLWRRQRFTALLLLLVLNLVVAPTVSTVTQSSGLGAILPLVSFTAVIVAALFAATQARRSRWIALSVGGAALACAWGGVLTSAHELRVVEELLTTSFLLTVFVLLVRHVLLQRKVTVNVVNAALCAYLLLGLGWASLYSLIELIEPGSFRLPEGDPSFDDAADEASTGPVYFSFVTLLTLGYGEIVPVSSIARMCAVVEAFLGQVLLVVLVSRLVGLQVGQEMLDAEEH